MNAKIKQVNSNNNITKNSYKITTKFMLKIVLLFSCSILGVGFISGSEIYEFFVRFKMFLSLGCIIFFALIFILTKKIFIQNNNYQNMLKMQNFDKNISNKTFLNKFNIKRFLLFLNCFAVSAAMFSGLQVLAKKLFFDNYFIPIILCLTLVFVVLLIGIKGLDKLDYFVLIFLIFIIANFSINLCFGDSKIDLNYIFDLSDFSTLGLVGSIFFACNYVFMNIIQVQPILAEFNLKFSKKQINRISGIFAAALSFVLILFSLFLISNIRYSNYSMPFLEYFSHKGGALYFIYVIGLVLALISSLMGCLFGVKKEIKPFVKKNFWASAFAIVLPFVFGFVDFKFFVTIVYPIVGVINFVIFLFL